METTRGLRRAARATAENETAIGVTFSCDFIVKLSRDADLAEELLEALEGVVSVADRRTVEFDKARDAIAKGRV